MILKNSNETELLQALHEVNTQFDNNIVLKKFEIVPRSTRVDDIRFTLTVKNSREAGSRVNREGRRISAACWHVHGKLFDALLAINPDCEIVLGSNKKVNSEGGNWQDCNLGSRYMPFYFSEACNC